MRIIVAMEGEKINWCYDTKDFATLPENRRIGLSVRFPERLDAEGYPFWYRGCE